MGVKPLGDVNATLKHVRRVVKPSASVAPPAAAAAADVVAPAPAPGATPAPERAPAMADAAPRVAGDAVNEL